MRNAVGALLLLGSSIACAESFVCSYPGYIGAKPVIVKVEITGAKATVGGHEYAVVENTDIGIVLVRAFALRSTDRNRDEVGLFGIAINKSSLAMTRGNIMEGDGTESIRHGRCVR